MRGKAQPDERSRLERMGEDADPAMPPVDAGEHLIDYLFEVGPVQGGGMGPVPLSHTELAAWQDNTGICLSSWEARTLRAMSQQYLSESYRAKDAACPPPWAPEMDDDRRKKVASHIRSLLRG